MIISKPNERIIITWKYLAEKYPEMRVYKNIKNSKELLLRRTLMHLILEENWDYEYIIQTADKAIEANPKGAYQYYIKARALIYMKSEELGELKKRKMALRCLDKAIKLDSKFSEAYRERGMFRYHEKKHEIAINDLDLGIKYDSEDPDLYFFRGLAKTIVKKNLTSIEEALRDFKKSLKLLTGEKIFGPVDHGTLEDLQICIRDTKKMISKYKKSKI
jgi:tetratricopeptide (TPR) repeat protein